MNNLAFQKSSGLWEADFIVKQQISNLSPFCFSHSRAIIHSKSYSSLIVLYVFIMRHEHSAVTAWDKKISSQTEIQNNLNTLHVYCLFFIYVIFILCECFGCPFLHKDTLFISQSRKLLLEVSLIMHTNCFKICIAIFKFPRSL